MPGLGESWLGESRLGESGLGERPGPTPELFVFELWSVAAAPRVAMRLELWTFPEARYAWYSAHLFRPDAPLVTLTEQAPLRVGLELRAPGLWADHNLEVPFEHWSLGLEAFALEVDHPAEDRGLRVPLGFELDWEMEPGRRGVVAGGFEQPARVRGEVLLGVDRHELDTVGWRSHRRVSALGSDRTGPQRHGVLGDGEVAWTGPVTSPTPEPWGWARSAIPVGVLRGAPWFDLLHDVRGGPAGGFTEQWSPSG